MTFTHKNKARERERVRKGAEKRKKRKMYTSEEKRPPWRTGIPSLLAEQLR